MLFVLVYFLLSNLIHTVLQVLSLLYMDYELSYTVIAYLDTFYPFPVFFSGS